MFDGTRIRIVVKPLDYFLEGFRVAIVPVVALALSLPVATGAIHSSATATGWLLRVVGPTIAITYAVLAQMHVVGRRVDRVVAYVRRCIALACDQDHTGARRGGGIACMVTPEGFQSPKFPYAKQDDLVKSLTRACRDPQPGQYWFVEGCGGTGKSRTALRLVQALVRDRALFAMSRRCHLYDLSKSNAVEGRLLRRLRHRRHEGALVLVDNFQLITPDGLQALTDLLIDCSESPPAQLLVFFNRPGRAWNIGPESDVKLLSEAKATERYARLCGPQIEVVAERIRRIDRDAATGIRELDDHGRATAPQLFLAQVVARNQSVPAVVGATIRCLHPKATVLPASHLGEMLGILAALSVHRGSFLRSDLNRCIALVAANAEDKRGRDQSRRLQKMLGAFRASGLIRLDVGGAGFVFHEQLAELCIDRLTRSPQFKTALFVTGRSRIHAHQTAGEALAAWLTAAETGAQDMMLANFDAARAHGATTRMTACLERASTRYEFNEASQLQFAILLDQRGDFARSRAVFADRDLVDLAPTSELAVLLAVSRVEARHPSAHEADLQALRQNQDPLVSLIVDYWDAHVATHRGEFDSDGMLNSAVELLPLVEDRGKFWQIHALERAHFDSLRAFYLSGRSDIRTVASDSRRSLDHFLSDRLPTFRAMHLLYRYAHLVGNVMLPRLAIFKERVSSDDAAFAGLDLDREATVTDLAAASLKYYLQVKEEFWRVGDRGAKYLDADVLNAQMFQEDVSLATLKEPLEAYQTFIEKSKFSSLNSYPHFYYFRWHVLLHYEQPGTSTADEHIRRAEEHLTAVITHDRQSGNVFGQSRARLLSTLLSGIRSGFDLDELGALKGTMAERGYCFERDLLAHLIGREGRVDEGQMESIFRFYPFVHQ